MPKLCLVFDIDDTLYLERDYVQSGFEYVARWAKAELGISDFAVLAWKLFLGGQRGKIFDKVLEESGVKRNHTTVGRLIDLYRSHPPKIRLLPDTLACVRALQDRKQLAIISDGPWEAQQNKVSALNLARWFGPILLTEEAGTRFRKPCPILFRKLQQKFQLAPERCCYIGDNPLKDFFAPRQLGWRTIRIRRQGGLYSALEASGAACADHELPDLNRLADLLPDL
jgi:putative hydrolase of the HAD superfamily